MARRFVSTLLFVFITQTDSQFFDFFGFQPITQSPRFYGNEYTTKRPKTDIVRVQGEPLMTWKNVTYTYSYDGIVREEIPREKKTKTTIPPIPTLRPIFNLYTTTTQKPIRKTKANASRKTSTVTNRANRENVTKKNNIRPTSSHDVKVPKNGQINDWYDRPVNNVQDNFNRGYEATTANYNYNDNNNKVIFNTNDYTTKSPIYIRPGVKPVVVDNRPPITNRPVTQRPHRTETQKPYYRPETQRPQIENNKPATSKPTSKPYIVNPIPTDAGAVVFPHEDEPPEIIRGADEDYMSDAEKRRYIEIAEKMCDKYKSLSTKQLAAIPLLPSPEPVSVNVSQCTPTQIPLVVGGKVVTINEFPHMALLGWVKIDGAGYSWKCGGSLVSDQYVLTAAHCSFEERDNTVITGPPRVVQLGSSYLDDPGALVVRVAAIIRHPKYKFPKSYYDLAIIKLVQPVTFSEVIKPACLGVPPGVDEPIIATGWGMTEFGGDQSVELRSVSLPIWNLERCREILGTSRKMPEGPLRDSQICAGEKRGGKDTCQGDSGGPAQLQDGCVWRVVAVTSLGRSCGAPNTPGLYALVQRAFVAAAVFGNQKNNQRRSDNTQTNSNNDNRRQNVYTTTQGYKSNTNRRTTTESYYNPVQNDYNRPNNNGRTTSTTTVDYYNPVQNDYVRPSSNRRTTSTTTESYYNPPQNDYILANNNHDRPNNNRRTTTTTESYYNPPESYYNQPNINQPSDSYNNRPNVYKNDNRALDTDAGFYIAQKEPNNPQSDFRVNDFSRRNDDRFEAGAIWFT